MFHSGINVSAFCKLAALSWQIIVSLHVTVLVISFLYGITPFLDWLLDPVTNARIFACSAAVLLALAAAAMTWGDAYMSIRMGARKPSKREKKTLDDISMVLGAKYLRKYGKPMPAILWHVLDDNSTNAMAYSLRSIAISRDFLKAARDDGKDAMQSLVGVAAHELGHLHYRDTFFLLIMSAVSWPLYLAKKVFMCLGFIPVIGPIISFVLCALIHFSEQAGWFVFSLSNRQEEYRADAFAASLVGPEGLMSFFDHVASMEVNPGSSGLVDYYTKSHPPTELRRSRIEQYAGLTA
ncbi:MULTISPECIES: M48 family metalloprotease [unclassified Haematospirillum]|uniref:M48 family metalloprotease n=1 Tax=unclassified Haematospirillum TaxID=2622088 RepID=UPI00143B361D|nr:MULTISPECIES: M48 family metalloprotease [unclassified Haematospirillum]NKD56014.1 M48 family metalloprotease [Haematospirillum sp. H4890]NKD76007.1 M48 family metalloprotease [Haematospirillum sp. H4485]